MKTTLIVENHSQFEDFLNINLYTWLGMNCLTAKNAKTAIELLQSGQDKIDFIICRGKMQHESTGESLLAYLNASGSKTPIQIIGEVIFNDYENLSFFNSALDIKPIVQSAAKSLDITAQQMAQHAVPEFFPIPIQHFNLINFSTCNIYDQLPDGQFKVVFQANEELDLIAIRELISIGKQELYVRKQARLSFVNFMNQEIAAKLELKEMHLDEQLLALNMSQQLLHSKIKHLGITQETIDLSKKNMKYMSAAAKTVPSLRKLLKKLLKNKSEYLFKHSQLLMFVSTHLLNNLDWVNEEQVQKLQFMAYWHDIALENSEQAKIHNDIELKQGKFTTEEKKLIKNHAQIAATLISKYPNAPIGVEQLIKQHHGTMNGVGFSEHYSQNISPMAIVFILSENLVDSIIKNEKDFNLEAKISEMRERFSTQRFQKIIDVLETIAK